MSDDSEKTGESKTKMRPVEEPIAPSDATERPEDAGAERPEDAGAERPEDAGAERPEDAGAERPEDAGAERPEDAGAERPEDATTAVDGNQRKRGGLGLAIFSLLLALLALAAAAYLYYRLVYQAPLAAVERTLDTRLEGVETQAQRLADARTELARAQDLAIDELRTEQQQKLDETRHELTAALSAVERQGPPQPKEWKLAEVEYLLRIANHRMLMERDIAGANQLLNLADGILAELDDFAYFQVRAQLADELQALQGIRGVDAQGLYLRIEALKSRIVDLPLRMPEYLQTPASTETKAETGAWEAITDRLSDYFKVRRFDGAQKPLLAPEEAVYLELNLRLMLERSQLALLRREQLIFEQSLEQARAWLLEFLNTEESVVVDLAADLEALGKVQLVQPLPDISGSLNALLATRRNVP